MSWPKGQLVFMYGGNKKETSTPFELELCGTNPFLIFILIEKEE